MPDELKEKRFLFAIAALHGMCVGGTVVANLLEDTFTDAEAESQKKSAKDLARASFLLADAMVEILHEEKEKP